MSLVFAAVAFKWLGVVIGAFCLLILFCIELWREAAKLDGEHSKLQEDLTTSNTVAARVPDLETQVELLGDQVSRLQAENQLPSLEMEGILESLAAHVEFIELVQKHRLLYSHIPDAPVTRVQADDDGDMITVTAAFAGGGEAVKSEMLGLVDTDGDIVCGIGPVLYVSGQQASISLRFDVIPPFLAEEIQERRSYNPKGLVLRLGGLCIMEYVDISDDRLNEIKESFSAASKALAQTITPTELDDNEEISDADRLAELEGLPDGGWVGFDEPGEPVVSSEKEDER